MHVKPQSVELRPHYASIQLYLYHYLMHQMHQLYASPLSCSRSPPFASLCAVRVPDVRPKEDGGLRERACGHWLAGLASTPPDHFVSTRCLLVTYYTEALTLLPPPLRERYSIWHLKYMNIPNALERSCLILVKLSLQLKSLSLSYYLLFLHFSFPLSCSVSHSRHFNSHLIH